MKKPNRIFNDSQMQESVAKEEMIEHKFLESLSDFLCEILNIKFKDRRIFIELMKNSLIDALYGDRNEGLLQQYLSYKIEEMIKYFKTDLLIPENIKINHSHHVHYKLSDLKNYIANNFIRIEDIKSDGTYETINEARQKMYTKAMESIDGTLDDNAPTSPGEPGEAAPSEIDDSI